LFGFVFLQENLSSTFIIGWILVISGSLIATQDKVVHEKITRYA
jgi:drug/metabolite transporter (DMT)-like permease